MTGIEIKNAEIESIGWDRERGLTQYISIKGDCWGCSLGGYHLAGSACYEWIMALMDALELYDFKESNLVGKVIRAKFDGNQLLAIGHPIKDKWLEPKVLFAKYAKGGESS